MEGERGERAVRMAAEDRRQQILEVAVGLFSAKGFRGTTTREIAQGVGVTEAIIFRHFATKGELYAAIIDWKACSEDCAALRRGIEGALESGDDRGVFEAIAYGILQFYEEDEQAMRLLMYSALEGHELSELFYQNHVARIFETLAEFIGRRIEEGRYRRVDAMTAVRAFVGMVDYHGMANKIFARQAREQFGIDNREAAKRFTEIFLASMLNHQDQGEGGK